MVSMSEPKIAEYSTLLDLLVQMEQAAEKRDRDRVLALRDLFCPEYARVMPEHYSQGSPADLYDVARNKILNVFSNVISPTAEEQESELAEAKRIIAMLKE
jgi:hypothetical protein